MITRDQLVQIRDLLDEVCSGGSGALKLVVRDHRLVLIQITEDVVVRSPTQIDSLLEDLDSVRNDPGYGGIELRVAGGDLVSARITRSYKATGIINT